MISKYRDKITAVEDDIKSIMIEEKEESHLRSVENKMNKAQNMLKPENGEEEADKRRGWFQTRKERQAERGDKMELCCNH